MNYVINYLQTQKPPRYLIGEMKTYIKRMIIDGAEDQQIFQYIIDISARIPFDYLDPTTRKTFFYTAIDCLQYNIYDMVLKNFFKFWI